MRKLIFKLWLKGICLRNRIECRYDIWRLNRNIDKILKNIK